LEDALIRELKGELGVAVKAGLSRAAEFCEPRV
jgi:hypothetical protein